MASTAETSFPSVPGNFRGFGGHPLGGSTESTSTDQRANYKEPVKNIVGTPNVDPNVALNLLKVEKRAARPVLICEEHRKKIAGVLDHVGSATSEVTLFYGGKENKFLFPTEVLSSSGVNYAGALFEIVMRNEQGFIGYDVVHKIEDEKRAHDEMGPLDLSFLDEIDGGPRTKPSGSKAKRRS